MKIVFMGTPDFAVPTLLRLLRDGHTVCGVFTQPDKARGRSNTLQPTPVKAAALEHGIPVYQPKSMKTPETLELLRQLSPELIVVIAFGKILPGAVLELSAHGCINVHASLLPKYRGAAPIQWSVLNGEGKTGVTTMQMDAGIDTGDMLLRAETPIGAEETAADLQDRLSQMGAQLCSETIAALQNGTLTRTPQDSALSWNRRIFLCGVPERISGKKRFRIIMFPIKGGARHVGYPFGNCRGSARRYSFDEGARISRRADLHLAAAKGRGKL